MMFTIRSVWLTVVVGCAIGYVSADEYKQVETLSGRIQGIRNVTILKGVEYYSFKGIPYAKPPVGDLRFKAPEPVESWAPKVLDAFEYGKVCIPFGMFVVRELPRSEDCLTLNIYVPANVNPNEKLAVLFFIHGGGFIDGSSDDSLYGPDFIVEKQTILVTLNYRLGVLGFLSLDTPEYSGNMGLKDQQLALKWISANIERFGGDSQRITVLGHSAGGASTHYHVLSAESRKYFRNAIPMSGTVDDFWAFSDDDHLKRAFIIAEQLGKPQETHEKLIEFLKSVPAEELAQFAPLYPLDNALFDIPVAPIIERKDAIRPFLVEQPRKLYETSDIKTNVMFTVTSREAVTVFPMPSASELKQFDEEFNVPLPFRDLKIEVDSKEHRKLMKSVRKFYFGNAPINEQNVESLYDYLSDVNFFVAGDRSVKLHARHASGKTYYVWYSMDSILNVLKKTNVLKLPEQPKMAGAGHGDDLCYLFRCDIIQDLYDRVLNGKDDEQSKVSLQLIDNISTLFTNFAKYGSPSHGNDLIGGFRPVEKEKVHSLNISNEGLKIGSQPREETIEFWQEIEKQLSRVVTNNAAHKREEL